jgi:uncharacterized cupredoxin-like copper-binding protein
MKPDFGGMPFFKKVALLGLGLFILGFVLLGLAILVEDPAEIVFAIITLAVALVIGALFVQRGTWPYVVGVLGGAFGLVMFAVDIPVRITTPAAFFDFTVALFALVGLVVMIAGSVAGFFQSRQPTPRTQATPFERQAILGVGAVLVVLTALSVVLTVANMDTVSAADREGAAVVDMKKTKFLPDEVDARAGTVKVVVKNRDPFLHTFTMDDQDIDAKVTPGQVKVFELSLSAGTYVFRCDIPGHEKMAGTITVR